MTKKRLTKIIVDILMFGDFIFLMSHANVRNLGHNVYGSIALFVLFVIHHFLNIWFYKVATKGKYNRWQIMLSVTENTKIWKCDLLVATATGKWQLPICLSLV